VPPVTRAWPRLPWQHLTAAASLHHIVVQSRRRILAIRTTFKEYGRLAVVVVSLDMKAHDTQLLMLLKPGEYAGVAIKSSACVTSVYYRTHHA